MGHQTISVIVCFVIANFYLGDSQNSPRLDWQFDPFSTDQWFKQKLDHYDSTNVQHWPQRYVTSYRFYRLGGPIFIFLSGPGPELTVTDIESGAIAEYAEEQGAFVIGLEHRFYGKSQPTQDLSTENLHFLTIPQTIEDIAAFIRSWRIRDEFRNSKWVLFGASYLGSLSAWFSQKHPELIDAFVASSAPLELRYEIPEFLENVGIIINETNPKCYETVAEGFSCLTKIFNEEDCQNYTLSDVKDKFEFCSELDRTRPLDATGVFAELFSTINAVVMYHDPSPDSFPDTNLDRFCKFVTDESANKGALDKIGERVKEINKHRGVTCAEFRFQTTVDFLKEKSWDSPAAEEGYRQLQWQLCNELGWTVASANISQPFGNYLTPFLHSEICQNLFGLTETEMRLKVLKANTDLKGKNLNTKCGIFVNGDKDPWHTFSITTPEEAGKCNKAILIEGGSHGRDVEDFSNNPSYPPQIRKAQRKISQYLDQWLKTGNCCDDEDSSESKQVISKLSRPARAPNPKEYYFAFNNLLKQPKVDIRPHSYPVDNQGKLFMAPTAIPYQVSTTDVLSVSPRIPVVGGTIGNQESAMKTVEESAYRDPRNTEFRRYRVVKLLRHRTPFAPTTPEPSMAPSMEQFEADFPEHSLRVMGRVERVFKNGTVINSTESPSTEEANEQLDLFEKGRRLLIPPISSNEVTPLPSMERGNGEELDKKRRFRYVVKQVFKDVVGVEVTSNTTQQKELQLNSGVANAREPLKSLKQKMDKNVEISKRPKNTAKRQQSLEDIDIESLQQQQGRENGFASSSSSYEESDSTSTSSSEQQSSFEKPSNINKPPLSKGIRGRKQNSLPIQKRESEEAGSSSESTEGDSTSASESIEHYTIKQPHASGNKSNEIIVRVSRKESKKTSTGEEKDKKNGKADYDDDDDGDDDYYDDDDYYGDDDDDMIDKSSVNTKTNKGKTSGKENNKTTNKTIAAAKPVRSKSDNISTEFSSGEDTRPRRLREKISEKIMSSSETVEGDQKSKEKTKISSHGQRGKGQKSNGSSGDVESLEDTESFSGEDYNYSLEPSGSNPKGSYRKKQLAPLTKPVLEQPGTVINVEISGSYPKRSHRKRLEKKKETVQNDNSSEVSETQTERPKRVRKNHQRKKVKKTPTTTTTTEESQTQEVTATTAAPTTTTTYLPDYAESPPTNSYATWNKGKALETVEALPVQQEAPTVINLNSGDSADDALNTNVNVELPLPKTNNDVMYIIIGDIPRNDNPNMIDDNPSHEALFNFIQKLVNRHSPGLFPAAQQIQESENLPLPLPPTTTTTTTTTTAQPPILSDRRYFDHTGKYLLIRPVQVVSLGRGHVVHSQDLKNESLIDLMTMETPSHPFTYESPAQNDLKRQYNDPVGGYRFKSPLHRDHFERLLSVDGQVRDSDRDSESYRRNFRRLDQIPDPSWRSIRGISQFGPVVPSQKNNGPVSSLLGLTAADTMWVNQGVPFLPRNRVSSRSHHNFN